MKLLFPAATVLLLLVGCSTQPTRTEAPPVVPVPSPVAKPDISLAEAQVRAVENKVDDVEDAVQDIGTKLERAQMTADSIESAVSEAYDNGIEAGSKAAEELKEFVGELKLELAASVEARNAALASLEETKGELQATTMINAELRSQIEHLSSQNASLFGKLDEANNKIIEGLQIAAERDSALKDLNTTTEQLKEARKYKRGVWIAILVVILYIIMKIVVRAGAWTPQGRIAKALF